MERVEAAVRRKGAIKFVLFGPVAIGVGYLVYWVAATYGHSPHGEIAIVLALPGAFALVGLLEAASGVPFHAFSVRWNQLKGWQRGVLGLLVTSVAAAIVFGVFVTIAVLVEKGRM